MNICKLGIEVKIADLLSTCSERPAPFKGWTDTVCNKGFRAMKRARSGGNSRWNLKVQL